MKKLFLFILLFAPFSLLAQKMSYGLKAGFILTLKEKKINQAWQIGATTDLRFRRFVLKNELLYGQFYYNLKREFQKQKPLTNHRIHYGLLPTLKIRRWNAIYLGGIFSYLFSSQKTAPFENKFNIGLASGVNFYFKKVIFDLSVEFPNFLPPSPYLFKLSLTYVPLKN